MLLFIEQSLNGLQFGLLLFLLAAGLTLVFGIMDLVNLAHGSLYMIGAYFAATFAALTGSFVFAIILALIATLIVGMAVEVIALRRLYGRDHLDHVLAHLRPDPVLQRDGAADLGPGGPQPAAAGLAQHQFRDFPRRLLPDLPASRSSRSRWRSRLLLYLVVMRTRVGMLIRAGASNREMIGALGINIKLLYTFVFGIGAALAGLAGMMQAPILTVQIGMGENILILAFVVIIIGGIGSIRGAFVASILVGMIDTVGRAFLPDVLKLFLSQRRRLDRGARFVLDADLSGDGGDSGVAAGRSVPGGQQMTSCFTVRNVVVAALLIFLALVPVYSQMTGNVFIMTLFTRIVILAIAAVSLNLIMGYGGMVSSATPPISASAAMRSASSRMRASIPASSSGRLRCSPARCSRSSPARCRCAPAASISS